MAGNKETLTQPHPCFSPWAQFQPFQTPLPPPCCVDICSSMVSSTGCFSHFFSLTLGWLGSILPFLQYVCMRRHTHVAVLRRDRLPSTEQHRPFLGEEHQPTPHHLHPIHTSGSRPKTISSSEKLSGLGIHIGFKESTSSHCCRNYTKTDRPIN